MRGASASTTEVERIPVHPGNLFYQEHLARYLFARDRLRPGRILDIACGTGYGADLLGRLPGFVATGVDLDRPAVHAARRAFSDRNVTFCIASGTHLPFKANVFQNIVSFETIEHIQDDVSFLSQLACVLAPDGVCVLSTPNRVYSEERRIENPYHVREYDSSELLQLLSRFFGRVTPFYQGFSEAYRAHVQAYPASIQSAKQGLPPGLRLVTQAMYPPVKRLIPVSWRNLGMQTILRIEYPQPDPADITISADPIPATSNFVMVCEQPTQVVM